MKLVRDYISYDLEFVVVVDCFVKVQNKDLFFGEKTRQEIE